MQIASRNALLRMAALMIAAGVALWYLCGRPAPGKRIMIPPPISTDQLRAHVTKLAGEFGEHNVANPVALRRAENYIAQVWREQGYTVVRQSYNVSGVDCANLEVTRRGAAKPDEIVLLGAHYDSVLGCPGANDNASGVAALLEISRVFAAVTPPRTLRFVAFVNEEPPHFQTAQQGSRVYARAAKQRGDDIRVMLALETLGWFATNRAASAFRWRCSNCFTRRAAILSASWRTSAQRRRCGGLRQHFGRIPMCRWNVVRRRRGLRARI